MQPPTNRKRVADAARSDGAPGSEGGARNLLSPGNAWRIFRHTTGWAVARATFYRWVRSGRLYSVRVGCRIFVPWDALDRFMIQSQQEGGGD